MAKNRGSGSRRRSNVGPGISPRGAVSVLAVLASQFGASSSLSLDMVASSWRSAPSQSSRGRSGGLNAPAVRLSKASSAGINSLYAPQDPGSIPTGFARMCNKAGGFAPRPVWDEITNGITPWFESKDGCYIYLNCNDNHWYVDNPSGAGMYLAVPDGSLLLPPTDGWVSLTGRRAGAPKISFI